MILSFGDKRTRDFACGNRVKAFDGLRRYSAPRVQQVGPARCGNLGPGPVERIDRGLSL